MTGKTTFKDEILNSIDDNLIADNSMQIKNLYLAKQEAKAKNKNKGFKLGILATTFAAGITCAIVIPVALNSTNTASVPETVAYQSKDLSFGVSSIAEVLSDSFEKDQSTQKAKLLARAGEPEDKGFWGQDGDKTNYLVPVQEMYSLVSPYLTTVDGLLNDAEFPYEIENNNDELYPFKLGSFTFNVYEDKNEEGETETEEEPSEGPKDGEPNFSFISEFYVIEGLLDVDGTSYPVTGQQITFASSSEKDQGQYSELYLNAQKDETHEVTIFKSTYSSSFSNSFMNTTLSKEYTQEAYAYVESELSTETVNEREITKRKIVNAIQIVDEKSTQLINEEYKKEFNNVYLSLDSSYTDEEEVENTISADMSFRLPNQMNAINPLDIFDLKNDDLEHIEDAAFRVDYECKIVKNTPFEMEEEFGHGQHREQQSMKKEPKNIGKPFNEYTTVFGTFYMYKDEDGKLIDPDFETEGRHQIITNGGYQPDWYDIWNW